MEVNERTAQRVSLACRIAYGAVALANLGIFFYWRGDANNIVVAALMVVLILNTKLIDMWRHAAMSWQEASNAWHESAEEWKRLAMRWKADRWN